MFLVLLMCVSGAPVRVKSCRPLRTSSEYTRRIDGCRFVSKRNECGGF